MSRLTDAEVYAEIAKIIEGFKVLECEKCVMSIIRWCESRGIQTILLKLEIDYRGYRKRNKAEFIVSDRYGDETITRNGIHYGVEVRGLVFDNLSADGRTREEWINDFHCRTGRLIVSEL